MALQKSAIEVPFGTSLNEAVRKELLDSQGAVARAENVVVDKLGSYSKRRGLRAYGNSILGGGTVSAGFSVHEFDQSYPLITDGSELYDWSQAKASWVAKGKVPEVTVERVSGVQPPPNSYVYQFDSVIVAGVRLTILTTPLGENGGVTGDSDNSSYSDVYYQVSDVASGAILKPITLLSRMFGPALVASLAVGVTPDGYATVFGVETTRNVSNVVTQYRLQAWTFNLAVNPLATPVVTVLESAASSTAIYFGSLSATPRGNSLVYMYVSVSLPHEIRIRTFWPATAFSNFAVSPIQNITGSGWTCKCLAIVWDDSANVLWVAFRDNAGGSTQNMLVRVLDAGYAQIGSDSLVVFNVLSTDQSSVTIALGQQTGGLSRDAWVTTSKNIQGGRFSGSQFSKVRRIGGSSLLVESTARTGVMAYSDPVNRSGRWYQWVQTVALTKQTVGYRKPITAPPNLSLVEVLFGAGLTLRPVATVSPNLVDSIHHSLFPHRVQAVSATREEVPVPVLRNASTTHLEVMAVDYADRARLMSAPFGDALVFSGGVASHYDGTQLAEVGFIAPPSIETTVTAWVSGNPGGKVLPGTYSCFCVWRATDARGNVHVSNISNVVTIVVAADSTVKVDFHPLVVTSRTLGASAQYSSVRAVLYATRANEGTFFEVDDAPAIESTTANVRPMYFDVDRNRLFYTQPGVPGAAVFRYAAPPLRSVIQHNGALCGVAEDGRTIWFSGLHLAGEGPWFNPAFVGYVDDLSPINALASMDGRLYAFTTNGIWAIDGNGFADNGEGGYAAPVRIAADAGCTNERSVVVTPVGTLFESELGIALLSRAGQVSWFGQVVEDSLAAHPTILSAVMVRPRGEVRYLCTSPSGDAANLVWNYRDNVWTTHRLPTSGIGVPVHSAMVQAGESALCHVLYSSGLLMRDGDNAIDSSGSPYVPTTIDTAWIKVAGVQGFQRVWRILLLFSRVGSAGLRMSLFYDYDDATPIEVREWTSAEVAALAKGEVEIHCARQKCTAVRVRIECVAPPEVTDGESFDYVGLRLIVGVKAKTPRGALAR